MGCFPTNNTWAAFHDGLNKTMVSRIVGTSGTSLLFNSYYKFSLTSGMTRESCAKICFENSFLFSAIAGLGFIFFKLNTIYFIPERV